MARTIILDSDTAAQTHRVYFVEVDYTGRDQHGPYFATAPRGTFEDAESALRVAEGTAEKYAQDDAVDTANVWICLFEGPDLDELLVVRDTLHEGFVRSYTMNELRAELTGL